MKNLTQPVSVFLSYAHEDERLKDRLVAALAGLEQDGLVNLWHDREIGAGKDWHGVIDDRLNQADLILLLVSPDFLASDFCRTVELARALERSERRQSRVIPVILRSCDWQATALGQFQALPRDGRPVVEQGDESNALAEVAAGVMAAALAIRAEALPAIWNVPFRRNPHFTGRGELLQSLRSALNSGRPTAVTQAVHGLGGVGKTQLAVEYAYRHASDYTLVWWLRSESPATLAGDYAQLADPLDLPLKSERDQILVVRAVRRWLENNKGRLLVFDNVEKPEDLREYLPQTAQGHAIVTSRNPSWHGIGEALPVGVLPRGQAIQLLLRRSGGKEADRDAAAKLAEELGDLPLALAQAAAYVDETGCSLTRYLELFQTHREEVLSRRGVTQQDYPASVAATWQISFRNLEEESPAAVELLNLCAFLAPEAIPLDLLAEGRQHLPERLSEALASPVATDELKAALRKYSLAEVKGEDIIVHRLVQNVVRGSMEPADRQSWAERAVRGIDEAFPDLSLSNWPAANRLLPHAQVSVRIAAESGAETVEAARVLNETACYLQHRGRYPEAESAHKQALAIREKRLGVEHPEVAASLHNLAVLYNAQAKYVAAEPLYERALAIYRDQLGADHPDLATTMGNLAMLYKAQGKYAAAEPLFNQVLAIRESRLGPNHPAVATSLNNLALLYKAQSRNTEAGPLLRRALAIVKAKFGPEHPHVATTLGNLGMLNHDQGDFAAAEPLCRQALALDERALGPDHPSVAVDLTNLATVCQALGKQAEAESLLRRALSIKEARLGPSHPSVATTLNRLAQFHESQGDIPEAERLARRALVIREEVMGPDHPDTAQARQFLAQLRGTSGQSGEAERTGDRAESIWAKRDELG